MQQTVALQMWQIQFRLSKTKEFIYCYILYTRRDLENEIDYIFKYGKKIPHKTGRKHKYTIARWKSVFFSDITGGGGGEGGHRGERRKENPPWYNLLTSVVFPRAQEGISESLVDAGSPGIVPLMLNGAHVDADGTKLTARPRPDLSLDKAGVTPMEGIRPNAAAVWGGRKLLLQLFCCGIQPRS